MGLFDKITNKLGQNSTDSEPTQSDKPRTEVMQEMKEEMVNVNRRSAIIDTHYENVSSDQAKQIAEILKNRIEESDGQRLRDIIDAVEDETGLPRDVADRVVHNERASINNMDTIATYRQQFDIDEELFYLPGELDERAHPVRVEVAEKIEERGGAVSLDELQQLFQQAAEKYDEEGGTPERVDHWVAHEKPRYTITRKVEL